jgi:hypothetical protein
MARDFHENYERGKIERPSDRATGFVFATVSAVVAVIWRNTPVVPWLATGLSLTLLVICLVAPEALSRLNNAWFKFGLLLQSMITPLTMLAIFVLVFVPAGAIMRIWRDPLRSRAKPLASTYWILRKEGVGSMRNAF